MCGLNGIFAYGPGAPPVDRDELIRVRDRMRARGPDGAGAWFSEDGRVAVRHVRRDAIEALKKESKAGGVTEDEIEHAEKEVQKLTDAYIGRIDGHLAHKEKEILTV